MLQELRKKIIPAIGLAILIYLGILIYADYQLIIHTFSEVTLINFSMALFVILVSFVIKFFRWQYYLIISKIKISISDSILIFSSGLLMSISPGKVGEFLKSYLLKQKYKTPLSASSTVILAERIIEFISLIFLILTTIIVSQHEVINWYYLLFCITIIAVLITNSKIRYLVKKNIFSIKFINKRIDNIKTFGSQLKVLFKPMHLNNMFLLSIVAWLVESVGVYLIVYILFTDIEFFRIFSVYLNSIFFGAVSMLPGGVGATEGSLVYMLNKTNMSENISIICTFLIRIATLWFSVIIGFTALMIFHKKTKNLN